MIKPWFMNDRVKLGVFILFYECLEIDFLIYERWANSDTRHTMFIVESLLVNDELNIVWCFISDI